MSIRNGEPELDKRLGVYLALIVTTIVTALVLGCGVGLAMSDKPESTGIAVLPAAATHGLRSTGTSFVTPTLPAANTPTAAGVAAASPATKAAAAESTPPPAQAAPSINSLTSILPTVTPSSRAATTAAPAGAATPQPSTAAD